MAAAMLNCAPAEVKAEEEVHEIWTVEDLIAVGTSEETMSWNYKLCDDLDLTGYNWLPIGQLTEGYVSGNYFSGDFDGNGHTISNLTQDNKDQAGLFYYISGSIHDLNLKDVCITYDKEDLFQGGVLAKNCFRFNNITISGNVNVRAASICFGGFCESLNTGYTTDPAVGSNSRSSLKINVDMIETEYYGLVKKYIAGCVATGQQMESLEFDGKITVQNFWYGNVAGVASFAQRADNLTNNGEITVSTKDHEEVFASVAGVLNKVDYFYLIDSSMGVVGGAHPSYKNLVNNGTVYHKYEEYDEAQSYHPMNDRKTLLTAGVCAAVTVNESSWNGFFPDEVSFDNFSNNGNVTFECISEDDEFLLADDFTFATGGTTAQIALNVESELDEVQSFGLMSDSGSVKSVNTAKNTKYAKAGLICGDASYNGTPITGMNGTFKSSKDALLNGKNPVKAWDNGVINGSSDDQDITDPENPGETEDPAAQTVQMYRLYNPNSGEHFYTSDLNERSTLISYGWKDEGKAWVSPVKSEVPVYRLYNPNAGDHHYTTDAHERQVLIDAGWNDENIGWYSTDDSNEPVYRLYNPNATGAGAHHYTTDYHEYSVLADKGWRQEGTGWYGLKQ